MGNNKQSIEQYIREKKFDLALQSIDALDDSILWKNSLKLHCLRIAKRLKEGLKLAEALYAQNTSDSDKDTLHYIGLLFYDNGKQEQAIEILSKLAEENADDLFILNSYATMLAAGLQLDEAEGIFRKVISINPSIASAQVQLARILCRTGRVEEGINVYQRASTMQPDNHSYLQRLVYWSNYLDKTTPQSSFQLAKLWAKRALPNHTTGSDTWRYANPEKVLKIGFISSDFCKHAVSFFVKPLLQHINREQFTVIAYSNVNEPDEVTEEIKQHCELQITDFLYLLNISCQYK